MNLARECTHAQVHGPGRIAHSCVVKYLKLVAQLVLSTLVEHKLGCGMSGVHDILGTCHIT